MSRIAWAAALLGAEYLGLSLVVDFPTTGEALRLVDAARILAPVMAGAGVAGVLIARSGGGVLAPVRALPPPARPWPALAGHLVALVTTIALSLRLFGAGAPPPTSRQFLLWIGSAALCVGLLAAAVASPRALARLTVRDAAVPVLAIAGGVLSWRALVAAEGLWGLLQNATLHAVAALLRLVASDVTVDGAGAVVGVGTFRVSVAPVCSGADGLGIVLVFQAVWLSLARARLRVARAALVLVPLGAACALAANVLRISVLLLVGAAGHEAAAVGGFHSKLGWLLFTGIAFGTMAVAERVGALRARGEGSDAGAVPESAVLLAPVLAALTTALVTSIWARDGFDPWYGARAVAAALALVAVRRSIPRPVLPIAWPPLAAGALVALAWIWWPGPRDGGLARALAALAPDARAAWIAVRVVGAVAVTPVIEELAFRGFLLPWLAGARSDTPLRRWPWGAVAISSIAFGAIHSQWLLGAAAGVVFAMVRLWRGRVGDAIAAHAAANAIVAAAALLGDRLDLWG